MAAWCKRKRTSTLSQRQLPQGAPSTTSQRTLRARHETQALAALRFVTLAGCPDSVDVEGRFLESVLPSAEWCEGGGEGDMPSSGDDADDSDIVNYMYICKRLCALLAVREAGWAHAEAAFVESFGVSKEAAVDVQVVKRRRSCSLLLSPTKALSNSCPRWSVDRWWNVFQRFVSGLNVPGLWLFCCVDSKACFVWVAAVVAQSKKTMLLDLVKKRVFFKQALLFQLQR